MVAALMIEDGSFSDLYSDNLTIKGLIPYYPANDLSSDDPFFNPIVLITKDSPPCLMYHGAQDGLVDSAVSKDIYNRYISVGNTNCSLIMMPFAGHASDVYFTQ